jgi:hypothetical protein
MCCGPGEVYSCKGHKCYPESWLGGEDQWCDVNLACYCEEAASEPCQVLQGFLAHKKQPPSPRASVVP